MVAEMTVYTHTSIMVDEVLEGLNVKQNNVKKECIQQIDTQKNGIFVDATFGRGGHTRALLEHLGTEAKVFAMDRDPEAALVAHALEASDSRFHFQSQSFSHLTEFCHAFGITGKVNGLLLDLGVSSPQLEKGARGFSFLNPGPLDMRMDPTQGMSAADWINSAEESEIQFVLKEYGEERFSKRIAHAIVQARRAVPIHTTEQLAEIVSKAHPAWERHKHPATKSFQAIRIFINNELEELSSCLDQSLAVLAPEGRLVVISFHSLEDRIVKRFIQKHERDTHPKDLPIRAIEVTSKLKRVGRKQKPSTQELSENRRSRSAVLRIAERIRNLEGSSNSENQRGKI